MQAEVDSTIDLQVTQLLERVSSEGDETTARDAYRDAFNRLRSQVVMYPVSGPRPSQVFESAAKTARALAAVCLPLGTAVTMHLYPLCALQCVPLPLLSPARSQRAMLLRAIKSRSLVVANAGSERAHGAQQPPVATADPIGIRIDGTCEYMSLANVADIVFLKARLEGGDHVVCAADLRADSVRIGAWKFGGTMRLSDTASVTFSNHRVPRGRYQLVPNAADLSCIADYQRCWFQLFLAEIYLARIEQLHRVRGLTYSREYIVSCNELSRLREYSLHLLDDFSSKPDIAPLSRTTSAMKLRVSLLAQTTIAELRAREDQPGTDAQRLRAEASELSYIRSQPTADEKILRSLGITSTQSDRPIAPQ